MSNQKILNYSKYYYPQIILRNLHLYESPKQEK